MLTRALSRHALELSTALVLVASLLLPEAIASSDKAPPLPGCFKTGSGYGTCGGMVIPGGGSVTNVKTANHGKNRFKFTGPTPLQTEKPVACGETCVYNHLDWTVGNGATVVSHCKTNDTQCIVKVPRRAASWAAVYVRQNNDPKQLWAIWNSGKVNYEISGDLTTACTGQSSCSSSSRLPIADARITVNGHKTARTTTDEKGHWSVEVPNGSYVASPGLGGGYSVKPSKRRVKVDDHNRSGVDFTACAAASVASDRAAARAAAAGQLAGGSCVNGVRVRYTAGASTMAVSWRFKQVCDGAVYENAKTVTVFKQTVIPRGGTDSVVAASRGSAVAKIFGSDGQPMMKIVINSGGKSAQAKIYDSSSDVHQQVFVGTLGSHGRTQHDCHPQAEEITLKG